MESNNNILIQRKNSIYECQYSNIDDKKVFGFWIYLMSDCILFSCLFATYAVLVSGSTSDDCLLISKNIFKLSSVFVETILLLFSSVTCNMSTITAMYKNKKNQVFYWMILTWFIGTAFIIMEIDKFNYFFIKNFRPYYSGFLSAFLVLISVHGLHIVSGLIWMVVLLFQIFTRGLTRINCTRIKCLSLFWHFLDIIWICIYSVVYLIGVT